MRKYSGKLKPQVALLLMLCVVYLMIITGCSSSSTADNGVPSAEPEPSPEIFDETLPVATVTLEAEIDEQVIYNRNGIVVTALRLDSNVLFGAELSLLIENNSDADICVQVIDTSVNDFMVQHILSETVLAGKKSNTTMGLLASDIKASDIKTIATIEFTLHFIDPETYMDLFDSDPITINTSAADTFTQEIDKDGDLLLDKDGLTIIYKGMNCDALIGTNLSFLIVNNSSDSYIVQAGSTSVNGFMVTSLMSSEVPNGKNSVTELLITSSSLEENGIEKISEIEFILKIIDSKTFMTLYETDSITISADGGVQAGTIILSDTNGSDQTATMVQDCINRYSQAITIERGSQRVYFKAFLNGTDVSQADLGKAVTEQNITDAYVEDGCLVYVMTTDRFQEELSAMRNDVQSALEETNLDSEMIILSVDISDDIRLIKYTVDESTYDDSVVKSLMEVVISNAVYYHYCSDDGYTFEISIVNASGKELYTTYYVG